MKSFFEESFKAIKIVLSDLKDLGIEGVDLSEKNLAILSGWEKEKGRGSFEILLRKTALCHHCVPSAFFKGTLLPFPAGKIRVLFLDKMPEPDALSGGTAMGEEAGFLLRKIVQAMKLDWGSVHISHCALCRISEKKFENPAFPCRDFLKELVTLCKPEVICALGEGAGRFLTGKKEPFSEIRGSFFSFESLPLMVTHHPADLLLDPELKRETWEDVKKIMAVLENPPSFLNS